MCKYSGQLWNNLVSQRIGTNHCHDHLKQRAVEQIDPVTLLPLKQLLHARVCAH